jgi:hypothetical protein
MLIYMSAAQLVRIEDRSGTGTCGCCGREGLRWVYFLTDGTFVGSECAKKIMGHAIEPRSHARLTDFHVIAEHQNKFGVTYLLWEHNLGGYYSETIDGKVKRHGSDELRKSWTKIGWVAA